MSLTISERFFEEFCTQNHIRYHRVVEGDQRSPDYDVFLPRRKVVVEVKEIAPGAQDILARPSAADGRVFIRKSVPGDKIRKKINDAAPQIRQRTKRRFPGLLLLYDASGSFHTDPYHIRVAMYGLETIDFSVPIDRSKPPTIVARRYGAKRKMTITDNTSISAVGVLTKIGADLHLHIFHNSHAAIPLAPILFSRYGARQFSIASPKPGVIANWVQI